MEQGEQLCAVCVPTCALCVQKVQRVAGWLAPMLALPTVWAAVAQLYGLVEPQPRQPMHTHASAATPVLHALRTAHQLQRHVPHAVAHPPAPLTLLICCTSCCLSGTMSTGQLQRLYSCMAACLVPNTSLLAFSL